MKNIKYLGKSEDFALRPPLVSKTTLFNEKNKYVNSVSNTEAANLIAENPRTFVEVPEIPPAVLTKTYLEKKDPVEIEAIVLKRFGKDLDRRLELPKLIDQALDFQKKAEAKAKADSKPKKAEVKKTEAKAKADSKPKKAEVKKTEIKKT